MQKFVSTRGRPILIGTVLFTLVLGINLFLHEKLYLIGALICGYLTALYYIIMLAARLKKAAYQSKERGTSSVRFGMLVRIFTLLGVMYIALKISWDIFCFFLLGFFFLHIVTFINLIIFSIREKIH